MLPSGSYFKIGVDVGGTNTDAALLSFSPASNEFEVVSTYKAPTALSITSGITAAISFLLSTTAIDRSCIRSITVGTTAFVNALVERDIDVLERVAVLRLCGPYIKDIPPFAAWPGELRVCCDGGYTAVDGGLEIHSGAIAELDEDTISAEARRMRESGIRHVAVVGVFSPLDNEGEQEYRVRDIFKQVAPEMIVVCSRDVGNIGFIERENATILNASLHSIALRFVGGISTAMEELKLPATVQLFLTTNSGTHCSAEAAKQLPIKTFTCGPTNSMAGAAFLTSKRPRKADEQVVVVDIGGTTTDIGFLQPNGFPRQAPACVEVAGVRTTFPMPDVATLPLGGGTIVKVDEDGKCVKVGPESLGYRIVKESILAGGTTMTVTDVAVASGLVACPSYGEKERVRLIPGWVVDLVKEHIRTVLATGIDSMKATQTPATVLLAGGGAIIVDEGIKGGLSGICEVIEVPFAGAANAVGAAVALVEGLLDTLIIMKEREEVVEDRLKADAIQKAVENGAEKSETRVVAVEKIQLQYVEQKVVRFIVRAVGPLDANAPPPSIAQPPLMSSKVPTVSPQRLPSKHKFTSLLSSSFSNGSDQNPEYYTPDIHRNIWYPSALDIHFISTGCGILGCGGGGSTYVSLLRTLSLFSSLPPRSLRIISPASVDDSRYFLFGSHYGAPSVSAERIQDAAEVSRAQQAAVQAAGISWGNVSGYITDEIGGGNGLMGLTAACVNPHLPVIDCDAMGRAFPSIEHATPYLAGCQVQPVGVSVGDKNVFAISDASTTADLEKALRQLSIDNGMAMSISPRPLTGREVKDTMVLHSLSKAWYIGRAIGNYHGGSVLDALFKCTAMRLVYTGKVVRVTTSITDGYNIGTILLSPLPSTTTIQPLVPPAYHLKIPFQNEFLYASLFDPNSPSDDQKEIIVAVPDLLTLLDVTDGSAIASTELKYGLRVHVVAMPADKRWKTPEGLKKGGLGWFGVRGKATFEWPSDEDGMGGKVKSIFEEFGR